MVGGNSSTLQAWDDTIGKLKARLSNWKLKTLSVGGRLTLLKSVLGSTPIYNMSIYKVPKSVLQTMESIRRNFFNGVQCDERKIVWIKWAKVLASKKYGGLGVSSFYALNRALLFKWVWRFISRDNSLWCRLIMSMHGSSLEKLSPFRYSTWKSIIREVHMLKDRGVDLISHCHIRVGNGLRTQFWNEVWIGDTQLRVMFPRIYALEINKACTVEDKLQFSVTSSLRRSVRGGVESSQLALLQTYIEGTLLSNMEDRWVWDLNGEGVFRVKDVRILLDECFLPKAPTATRWVKYVPIKINVFAWKVFLDRLPTRSNLQHRGVLVSDLLCPLCSSAQEDSSHLFFSCRLATDIVRLVCRWWNLSWTPLGSYADWLNWFNSIRLSSKVKDLLEGVLYITWWSVWMFRNQLLFSSKAPRKDVIFDDIVSRSFTWCLSRKRKCDDLNEGPKYFNNTIGHDIWNGGYGTTSARQRCWRRLLYNRSGLPENYHSHNSANEDPYMDVGTSHTSGYAEGSVILDFADPTRHLFAKKQGYENVDKFRCAGTRYSRDYTYECLFRQTESVSTQGESSRNNSRWDEPLNPTTESVQTHMPYVTGVSNGFQVVNAVDMLAAQNNYPPNVDCPGSSLFGDINSIHINVTVLLDIDFENQAVHLPSIMGASTGFQIANNVDMLTSKNNYPPNVDHFDSPLFGAIRLFVRALNSYMKTRALGSLKVLSEALDKSGLSSIMLLDSGIGEGKNSQDHGDPDDP
ncbi:RNA-directed DNA polymerase, eukaryota [Tanacetum coccineum]